MAILAEVEAEVEAPDLPEEAPRVTLEPSAATWPRKNNEKQTNKHEYIKVSSITGVQARLALA